MIPAGRRCDDRDLNPVAVVTEQLTGPRDSATTLDRPGHPSATLRRQSATPGDEIWTISGHGCQEVSLRGEVLGHRATISSAGRTVATGPASTTVSTYSPSAPESTACWSWLDWSPSNASSTERDAHWA